MSVSAFKCSFFSALSAEISRENASPNTNWVDYLDKGVKLCEALPTLEFVNPDQTKHLSEVYIFGC